MAPNFLITGADNGACVDPDSPYAAAFGDREGMGERSDTIMMFRVDPATPARRRPVVPPRPLRRDRRLAATSPGSTRRSARRAAAAHRHDLRELRHRDRPLHPGRLLRVQDARRRRRRRRGAVPVPGPRREHRAQRAETGCFTFDGEHALAYVRSRHYEYENPPGSGNWQDDPTSDLGRISRQQDFIRRVLSSVLAKGRSTRRSPAASSRPRRTTSSPTPSCRRRSSSSSPAS